MYPLLRWDIKAWCDDMQFNFSRYLILIQMFEFRKWMQKVKPSVVIAIWQMFLDFCNMMWKYIFLTTTASLLLSGTA